MPKLKEPQKTSERKRPNRKYIEDMVAFRGHMTGNEKTALATLDVKNVMQRVNNRTLSDNVNNNLSSVQNEAIQKLIKQFVKDVDTVISDK